jgi:hypothetical protein
MILAQAADDVEGFVHHNGDVLDIFLLVATIVFLIAAFLTRQIQPWPLWSTLTAFGLACVSFALMFL